MTHKRTVLVTGACGFIGSHLVEELIKGGWAVRAFVYYNAFNSWGWLDTLPRKTLARIDVFPGDIRDPHRVRAAVRGVDTVYHLAALIGIPYSYHSPDSYVATNVRGTLNVLQAAKDTRGCRRVIVTSTSEVYGTARRVPIDESHPFQAQSPYAASKIGADRLAESFYRSYRLPVTIVRPFNTYGPRQSARAIIPTVITQLLSGARQIRLGNLHPTRDFNYVRDIVRGFVAVAQSRATIGEEINIATQTEIAIGDVVRMIADRINPKARIVADKIRKRPTTSEVTRLLGANEKISRLTGWRPRTSLDEGLKETIRWFRIKDNLKRYKPGIFNY